MARSLFKMLVKALALSAVHANYTSAVDYPIMENATNLAPTSDNFTVMPSLVQYECNAVTIDTSIKPIQELTAWDKKFDVFCKEVQLIISESDYQAYRKSIEQLNRDSLATDIPHFDSKAWTKAVHDELFKKIPSWGLLNPELKTLASTLWRKVEVLLNDKTKEIVGPPIKKFEKMVNAFQDEMLTKPFFGHLDKATWHGINTALDNIKKISPNENVMAPFNLVGKRNLLETFNLINEKFSKNDFKILLAEFNKAHFEPQDATVWENSFSDLIDKMSNKLCWDLHYKELKGHWMVYSGRDTLKIKIDSLIREKQAQWEAEQKSNYEKEFNEFLEKMPMDSTDENNIAAWKVKVNEFIKKIPETNFEWQTFKDLLYTKTSFLLLNKKLGFNSIPLLPYVDTVHTHVGKFFLLFTLSSAFTFAMFKKHQEEALLRAVKHGDSTVVKTLLKTGRFNITEKDRNSGLNIIELAAQKGPTKVVMQLLKHLSLNEIEALTGASQTMMKSAYFKTPLIVSLVKALDKQKSALGGAADLLTLIVDYLRPATNTTHKEIQEVLIKRPQPVRLSQKTIQVSADTAPAEGLRKAARL